MSQPRHNATLRSPIHGRERELESLRGAVDDALGGRGGLWLLSGEPGIGKTRLAEESERIARAAGFRCAWGRCWESGGAPPFWPFTQVLRTLGAGVATSRGAPKLAALSPEFAGEPQAAAASRFELFDAVCGWFAQLAQTSPLWVCLEDLHAADPASLALLESLAAPLKGLPVMLVGTARDAAMAASPSRPSYERVVRQAQLLKLGRLDAAASRTLLRAVQDDERWLDTALVATAGLPLYLVELARLATTSPDRLEPSELVPASIQAVLRARSDGLAERHLPVLIHAALLGMDVDQPTLTDLFGSAAVEDALGEACALELVQRRSSGEYRLSHALLRDVFEQRLAPADAERAHARIAKSLSASGAPAEALAHHCYLAGAEQRAAAIQASLEAAEDALARFAFEDALEHVEQIRTRGGSALTPLLRARAGVQEGLALIGLGRVAEGQQACRAAGSLAEAAGAAEIFAAAALAYGSVYTFANVDAQLVAMLERVLGLLPDGDSPLRAQLLARLAAARQPDPVPSRPMELARSAIAMAERLGNVGVLAATLRAGCSTLVDLAHPRDRLALDQRHLDLALSEGLGTDELLARQRLVFDCMELGDFRASQFHIDELLGLCEQRAHSRQRWRSQALSALRELWSGEIEKTGERIEEVRRLGRLVGDRNAEVCYAYQLSRWIELGGRGHDIDAVADALGRAFAGSPSGEQLSRMSSARFYLICGRTEAARAMIDADGVRSVLDVGDRTMLLGAAMWAAAARDVELANRISDHLRGDEELFVNDGVSGMCWRGPVALVLSFAAQARGELDAAWQHAVNAAQRAETAGGKAVAAEAWGRAALLADELGRSEAAAECRLRASGRSVAPDPSSSLATRLDDPRVIAEGDVWCVSFRGRTTRVKTSKGMAVLAHLIAHPATPFHVLELSQLGAALVPVDRGDAGELLDERARSAYRERAAELRAELSEAEANHDLGRVPVLRNELEALAAELARGTGLAGRARRAPAAEERARQAIRKQLRSAINRLADCDAELGRYLERAVQTGRTCQYDP